MEFNKEKIIEQYKPLVGNLMAYLNKKKIGFKLNDGRENIVVCKHEDVNDESKWIRISHRCFYRYSGLTRVHKEKDQNLIELVDVTDEMWIENYMKPIIELLCSK